MGEAAKELEEGKTSGDEMAVNDIAMNIKRTRHVSSQPLEPLLNAIH